MNFAFTEEQRELRRGARRFLERHAAIDQVRATMETEAGFDRQMWRRMAELGWPGLIIDEAAGGVGLGYVELVGLMEELGRTLVCAPFFSTVCLGVNALQLAGGTEQQQRYLPGIAAGDTTATVAFSRSGKLDPDEIDVTARRDGAQAVLSGAASLVVDGHTADLIVVAARAPGSSGSEGVDLYVVPGDAPGLTRTALPTMDQTRRLARLQLDEVAVPLGARLDRGSWPVLARTLDLAAIALSAEQVGGAQRCLELSVDYARTRTQFGQPIGSFQAIQHKCADMLTLVESARSASYWAGWAAATGDSELAVAAPLAKATCSDAYFRCAAEAIQIHGGVGFTWECDVQLYFKRAKSSESLLGDATFHREELATRQGW